MTVTLVDTCDSACLQSLRLVTVLVLACQWNSNLLIAVHANALHSRMDTQAFHMACIV